MFEYLSSVQHFLLTTTVSCISRGKGFEGFNDISWVSIHFLKLSYSFFFFLTIGIILQNYKLFGHVIFTLSHNRYVV